MAYIIHFSTNKCRNSNAHLLIVLLFIRCSILTILIMVFAFNQNNSYIWALVCQQKSHFILKNLNPVLNNGKNLFEQTYWKFRYYLWFSLSLQYETLIYSHPFSIVETICLFYIYFKKIPSRRSAADSLKTVSDLPGVTNVFLSLTIARIHFLRAKETIHTFIALKIRITNQRK